MTYNEFFTTIFQNGPAIPKYLIFMLLAFAVAAVISSIVFIFTDSPLFLFFPGLTCFFCGIILTSAVTANLSVNLTDSTCTYIEDDIASQVSFKTGEIEIPTTSTVDEYFTPTEYIQAYSIDDTDSLYVVLAGIIDEDFGLKSGDRLNYIKLDVPDEIFDYIKDNDGKDISEDKKEKAENYCIITSVNGKNIYTNLEASYPPIKRLKERVLTTKKMYKFLCQEGYITE